MTPDELADKLVMSIEQRDMRDHVHISYEYASEIAAMLRRLATAEADADRGWHWAEAVDLSIEPARYVEWYQADRRAHDEAVARRSEP